MRLFIALDLPEKLSTWVTTRQEELKRGMTAPGMRWAPREQWHVTLRFLGGLPERRIPAIYSAMKDAVKNQRPFDITCGKFGTFSGPRMGVLWLGVEQGLESVKSLVVSLNERLEAAGFPAETRPLRAHLTLARSRHKISSAVLRGLPLPPACPAASIDRLHLYQSVLDSQGAHYTRLHTALMSTV